MLVSQITPASVSKTSGRILIIEDQPSSREYLAKILLSKGYQTAVAPDAQRGLKKLNATPFDLVLLDINLPGMDGFELCSKIKENPLLKDISIIFITGLKDEHSIARGLEMGAEDYLTKPFSEPELLARVSTQLKLKKTLELCRQSHELVSESEKNFRALFMNSPVMLIQLDQKWKIQQANNIFSEHTGFSTSEVIDCYFEEFLEGAKISDIFKAPESQKKDTKVYLKTKRNISLEVKLNITLQKEQNKNYHIIALEILSDGDSLLPKALTHAEKYKQLFSASGDSILMINEDGIITEINPAANLLFECKKEALIGKKISSLSVGASNINTIQKIQQQHILEARRKWHYIELTSPTGKFIFAEANLTLLDLPGEKGYFLILHDLVNRKTYQEKIAEFNQLAETSGQGLALVKPSGEIYYVNPTLNELLNSKKDQHIYDYTWEKFIPEKVKHYFQHTIFPKILKEEKWAGNLPLKSGERSNIFTYLNISLIKNETGKPHLIAISVTDMSEAHAAEQERLKLEGRFREFAENLPQTLFELDPTGKITYVNKFGLSLFGFTAESLKTNLNVRNILHKEDIPGFEKRLGELIIANKTDENYEYRFRQKNGTYLYGTVYAQFFQAKNRPGVIQGLMVDNTTNKRLLDTIHNYNKDLKKLNATKDRFFSILAHDLKNPFTAIIGFSELMVKRTSSAQFDAKQIHMYANELLKAANNSYNLVENLLDWSHSQREKLIINPENLSISDIVDDNIMLFQSAAENKKIRFYHQIDKSLRVYADYNTLNTVVRNLISNAIKFSYPEGKIFVNSIHSNEKMLITVADQGKGIPAENLPKLFRIDEAITTEGTQNERGTGLGLVICKEFIDKNDGSISVNSKEGKGSIFTIVLPAGKVNV